MQNSGEKLIEVKNLAKQFFANKESFYALKNIDLEILKGEILGVVGESGSGKSTLGKILCGLYEKTTGEVLFEGKKMPDKFSRNDHKFFSSKIQFIFQNPYSSINPRMTVFQIIAEGLNQVSRLTGKELNTEIVYWLEKVGLSSQHLNRYPHEFSGGQKQRIGIARALAVRPDFLICDEPISALDVSIQGQIVNLIKELHQELGLTIMFIAHDLAMVRFISDRIAVLHQGDLKELGDSEQVYREPANSYTKKLLSANLTANPKIERYRKIHNTAAS